MAARARREACQVLEHLLERRGLRWTLNLAPAREPLVSDGARVREVLCHLLENAIKSTHEGGVEVSATPIERHGRRWVVFGVSDTGLGLPKRIAEELGAGRRLERRWLGDGVGLGLILCQRHADALGAQLHLVRTGPEGTTLELWVPDRSESYRG